jgi:hypothetical protein
MTIKGILMAGAALATVAAAPALAKEVPHFSVTALHTSAAHVVNKSSIKTPGATNLTYTYGVYSTDATAGSSVHLIYTYYKWNNSYSFCSNSPSKIKVKPKKTPYGKAGTATETYSYSCPQGPTVFYGVTFDWNGSGSSVALVSTLTSKIKLGGVPYKAHLNLDISLTLG